MTDKAGTDGRLIVVDDVPTVRMSADVSRERQIDFIARYSLDHEGEEGGYTFVVHPWAVEAVEKRIRELRAEREDT